MFRYFNLDIDIAEIIRVYVGQSVIKMPILRGLRQHSDSKVAKVFK